MDLKYTTIKHASRMLIFCLMISSGSAAEAVSGFENQYQEALNLVRSGDLPRAESILHRLTTLDPENRRFEHDYIQVLGLLGKDQKVLEYAGRRGHDSLPVYVLETIARSARNLRNYDLSRRFYTRASERSPDRLTPKIGLALLSIDQRDVDPAVRILSELEVAHPDDLDVLYALAYAWETSGDLFQSLRVYEKILRLKPGDSDILRRRIIAINELGANAIAIEKAQEHEGLLSADQWARLKWDKAAHQVRWGEIPSATEKNRFDETDRAINTLHENLKFAENLPNDPQTWSDRARYDLIVALRDRREMRQVIQHAERLQAQGADPPAYVLAAIGDAYLYLENPEAAQDWYLKALRKDPRLFNVELALFYAYIEAEEFESAFELIDRMAAEQTDVRRYWVDQGKRALVKGNPRKTLTETTAALARAYGNDLEEAQRRIDSLAALAPFNPNLRKEKANIYYWRGWPRAAQKEYEQALNIDPKDLGLKLGLARNHLERRRYREAERSISELAGLYREDKEVRRQNRLWQIHNDRELQLDVKGGISSGTIQGSDTLTFDQRLFSAPLDYDYRVFLHTLWNKTTFPEGIGRFGHYGLGVEYRQPDFLVTAEIHDNDFTEHRVGGTLFGAYNPDDYWSFSGSLQSFSAETPYRALKNGVFAESVDLAVGYRVSESRSFDGGGGFLNFSDGNKRFSLAAEYLERWIAGPSYLLDTHLNVTYSNNSKSDVPYFNPKNDVSAGITFDHDWLTYRRYDKAFHQRLALTGAGYWQDGFGVAPVGSLLYEHRWTANYCFDLKYGAAVASRVYDGIRQLDLEYFMTLNWRF